LGTLLAVCGRGKKGATPSVKHHKIAEPTRCEVLTEAGYRCAVPKCPTGLAIDLHHVVQVADGGRNVAANLLALCPNCRALLYWGVIRPEHGNPIWLWSDGIVRYAGLIIAVLVVEPLLNAAANESREAAQDLWAALLANAMPDNEHSRTVTPFGLGLLEA
jgi:hypothetical protein